MENENDKNEHVTKAYLEETLDKRFKEQAGVIIEAVDSIVNKRVEKVEKEIRKELYIVRGELKEEAEKTRKELKHDINKTQTLIDGYVKKQEDSNDEFVIVKEEVKQIKSVIGDKLGVEIRAV